MLLKTREAQTEAGDKLPVEVPHYELRPPSEPPRRPEGFLLTRSLGAVPLPFAAGVPLLLSVDGDLVGGEGRALREQEQLEYERRWDAEMAAREQALEVS